MGKWTSTHPGTLSSNKLVIFSLDTGPAASIIVLLFKVRVIFQFLWCLWKTQKQTQANSLRDIDKLKKKKIIRLKIDSSKGQFSLPSCLIVWESRVMDSISLFCHFQYTVLHLEFYLKLNSACDSDVTQLKESNLSRSYSLNIVEMDIFESSPNSRPNTQCTEGKMAWRDLVSWSECFVHTS